MPQPLARDDLFLTGHGPGWMDPQAAAVHGGARVGRYTGPLFRDGPSPGDVQQGELGNCYFGGALAGLAAVAPQAVRDLIRPSGDGSAIITFHGRDPVTGQFQPVEIRVDPELYEARPGQPIYGRAAGDRDSMELWFPLVEKAWATWKGGYEAIGQGGVQNAVFEAVLGRPAGWMAISPTTAPEAVWGTIQATLQAGLPLGAATESVDDGRYANSGVYADHGYSVLGAEVDAQGEKVVVLRNPWGKGEPLGDGVDDGVFRMKLPDFIRLYSQLQFPLV